MSTSLLTYIPVLVLLQIVCTCPVLAKDFSINGDVTTLDLVSSLDGFSMRTEACFLIKAGPDAVENGANLRQAYAAAAVATPYGNALSSENRVTLLLPPGRYDLGSVGLVLFANYIDIIGQIPVSLTHAEHSTFSINGVSHTYAQTIWSGNHPSSMIVGSATFVLKQIAGDVHLKNLCVVASGGAAVFPADGSDLSASVIKSCLFKGSGAGSLSMQWGTGVAALSGTFEDCVAGDYGFTGSGMVSGTFLNCVAGANSFGDTASGSFISCTGGANSFGAATLASGGFRACVGGDGSFGAAASGTFNDCIALGSGFGANGDASGHFTSCTAGPSSFGAQASGAFKDCLAGDNSFAWDGTASGTFIGCEAGANSFGVGTEGLASGVFAECKGGSNCFGSQREASGSFSDCQAGNDSFGSVGGAGGKFNRCIAGERSFGYSADASGTFSGCKAGVNSFWNNNTIVSGSFLNCRATVNDAFGGYSYTADTLFTNRDRRSAGLASPDIGLPMGSYTFQP